jgi:hypothetical protein
LSSALAGREFAAELLEIDVGLARHAEDLGLLLLDVELHVFAEHFDLASNGARHALTAIVR